MTLRLYGIKTCDTCRKALKSLRETGFTVEFTDVRDTPLDEATLARFLAVFGDRLVNRASATWRALDEAERDEAAAVLLARHPTLMKRPVIADGDALHLGWGREVQAALGAG